MGQNQQPQQQQQRAVDRIDPRIKDLKSLFAAAESKIKEVIPKHLTVERMLKVSLTAITRTPALLECTPASLLQAVMQAAELGLEPGGVLGEGYLIPYWQGKGPGRVRLAQFQPGYRGLITLARRSGLVDDVEAVPVRHGDKFLYRRGTNPVLDHEPAIDGEIQPLRSVYAIGWLKASGRPHVEHMTKAEVDRIRARSKTGDDGPWVTDYDEMAKKTVVRRLCKYLPQSIELQKAIELDNREYDDNVIDVDLATETARVQGNTGLKGRALAAAEASRPPADSTPARDVEAALAEPTQGWGSTGAAAAAESAEAPAAQAASDRVPGADDGDE